MSLAVPFDAGAVPRPARFTGPAVDGTPHPLAERAARSLMAEIDALAVDHDLRAPGAGKMFGVLVVEDEHGALAVLRGFSGMLGRRWVVPGFVPPLFDPVALAAFWPAGEASVDAMTEQIDAWRRDASIDPAEIRRLEAERRARSQGLWLRIMETYRIADRRGELRTMADLFAPGVPPGGAGDCAGPKLVGAAHGLGLRPLALAEVWWGAPMGTRTHGSFHAPCRKCEPVLGHMLSGS